MERLRYKYEADEASGLRLLASRGSISSTIFLEWRLSRTIIKNALHELCHNRRLQVTLASILVGTRFKHYDKLISGGSVRLPTQCRLCEEPDSPAHILKHMGISKVPSIPEEIIEFLGAMAEKADAINPHIPKPYPLNLTQDMELDMGTDNEEESIDKLSFDGDYMTNRDSYNDDDLNIGDDERGGTTY